MRLASASLKPVDKWGLRIVGACQYKSLSVCEELGDGVFCVLQAPKSSVQHKDKIRMGIKKERFTSVFPATP